MLLDFEKSTPATQRPLRIGIVTEFFQRIGGTETYLSTTIPELLNHGHQVVVFVGNNSAVNNDTITRLAPDVPVFAKNTDGEEASLRKLRNWKPDLLYAHGLLDNALERKTQAIAKNLFFLHVYHGSCISGRKRFAFPTLQPCNREFGVGCLLRYHARRCGGLNPVTMLSKYFYARDRLANLLRFDSIVTHSFHMFNECVKHQVPLERLYRFHYSSEQTRSALTDSEGRHKESLDSISWPSEGPIKLLFCARLDQDKGSELIIETARKFSALIRRPIELTIVGDGPSRKKVERQIAANDALVDSDRVRVSMTGWLSKQGVHQHIQENHLVAFASVWPEPFGLVGPEAAQFGKPVAAFDVGGVRSWLVDDVNGFLAPGMRPSPEGLARALADCVRDERTYRRLSMGAFEMSERFRRVNHMLELERIFCRVLAD